MEYMVLLAVVGTGRRSPTPSLTGLIPEIASAQRLQQANAMNGPAQSLGAVLGPAVSRNVAVADGPGRAVAADVTYLVSALHLAWVKTPLTAAEGRSSMVSTSPAGRRDGPCG